MDSEADRRRDRWLTSGKGTWSARCREIGTSGAAGGPGKRSSCEADTAPRSDPTLLHAAHLEDYRRMMGAQLNVGEGRNGLARAVFFAHHGQLRRGYERGMEDQLGALGLGLNAIVFWNSLYIDAAVKKLAAGGMKIGPEIRAHLSPLQWEHINFHGTYPFNRPELPGRLRDLRDPTAADDPEL